MSSNSSDYFLPLGSDPKTGELNFVSTLHVIPPKNPLTTTNSINNNIEDPLDLVRSLIMNSMLLISTSVVSFTNADPLSLDTSNYIMCWVYRNFPEMTNLLDSWGEELKYSLTNCNDQNDTDPKTNHKYKLFLEYFMLLTRRYFSRTRESMLVDDYILSQNRVGLNPLISCDSQIKNTYYKFRQNYFKQYYNNLRNIQLDYLFTNTTVTTLGTIGCGWLDVQQAFIDNVLQPFRSLTINGVSYDDFLTNLEFIVTNCHDLLSSNGVLAQFITSSYVFAPFSGLNVSHFDDKLKCLYQKALGVPDYFINNFLNSPAVIAGLNPPPFLKTSYYSDQYVDWYNLAQNNRSILSCLIGILYNFIFHIMDKFIRYEPAFLSGFTPLPIDPTNGITNEGANVLLYLSSYLFGGNTYQGLFILYSNTTANLPDSDIEYIFGAPDDTGNRITGILRYVISKLRDLLTYPRTTNTIQLRSDNNIGATPNYDIFTAENSNSFFFGAFDLINWLQEPMLDSTINIPSKFNLQYLLKTPESIIINKINDFQALGSKKTKTVTLEKEILTLISPDTLENCIKAYVSTHLNILEGLNIPTTKQYFTPSITLDASNNISTYQSITVQNIFEYTQGTNSCPANLLQINFLSQFEFDNPNIINIKYYCIAIINYILFGISRQVEFGDPQSDIQGGALPPPIKSEGIELPALNISALDFPFNTTSQTFIYGLNSGNTSKLLYDVVIWYQFIFTSFYGNGQFFDPNNLSEEAVCINPNWTTTPLIKNLFSLQWKHNPYFLNYLAKIISDQALDKIGQLFLNGIPDSDKVIPIPYCRITNLERVDHVNTQKTSFATISKQNLKY